MENRKKVYILVIISCIVISNLTIITPIIKADSSSWGIDTQLVNLINTHANEYYNANWEISLSQYKSWITLISLREAGYGRYGAHSQWGGGFNGDRFNHVTVDDDFSFSTGIGAFQLDRGGDQGDATESWSTLATIEKIDPEISLISTLRWHRDRFNGPGYKLADFSQYSAWNAVKPDKEEGESEFISTWTQITGESWYNSKYTKKEVSFNPPTVNDPFENIVEYIGKTYWYLDGWNGYYDTWLISARRWNGNLVTQYYYTMNEDTGWEVWVWKDSSNQYIHRYERYFLNNQFPENRVDTGSHIALAGSTGTTPALDPDDILSSNSLFFSGYFWDIRQGSSDETSGPGPNYWSGSTDNVWVDDQGQLHLKITKDNGKWYCSEIISKESFGFGKYIFYVANRVDLFNKNVVGGLFTYEGRGNQEPMEYEIDIEFSKWGEDCIIPYILCPDNAQYVFQYRIPGVPTAGDETNQIPKHSFKFGLNGDYSTHSFIWKPDYLYFESYHGHYENLPSGPFLIDSHPYNDDRVPPESNEKVHLNLWLYDKDGDSDGDELGKPPSDEEEVEMIIKSFKFIPIYETSLDLIFVIDTTGSMYDDIAAVKNAATEIVNEIDESVPDYRIAVVAYRDEPVYPYGSPGDYRWKDMLGFSSNKDDIISAIQSLTVGGGADWEESVYSALIHSIDASTLGNWRGEEFASKSIIWMGDAPPHDPEPYGEHYTLADVVQASEDADPVHIFPIQIGGSVDKMDEIAEQTGGQIFTASQASEVPGVIIAAIEQIKSMPLANANGPYEGYIGFPLMLDGSNSIDHDGFLVSFEWDLDDDGDFDDAFGASPTVILDSSYSTDIHLKVTDDDGFTDFDTTTVSIVDNIPPVINIIVPSDGQAIQDGVTFEAEVSDPSGVDWVTFSIREPDGGTGTIIDPAYESISATDMGGDVWQLNFDTILLPDGYYLLLCEACDIPGNQGNETVEFSIRNWAVVELLPSTPNSKAGRTMPIKFSIRVVEAVDPVMPFVWNEDLNILIYEEGYPETILQNSTFGDRSKEYRISSEDELYITNFKTSKKPTAYVVEIWRKDMLLDSFQFETVK